MKSYELIIAIVSQGFSESVMDAAVLEHATGGTVISARGTAKEEILSKFKLTLTPEKEIVLIVCKKSIKENVLKSINERCGLESDAHGIAFSLPIDNAIGIKEYNSNKLNCVNNDFEIDK